MLWPIHICCPRYMKVKEKEWGHSMGGSSSCVLLTDVEVYSNNQRELVVINISEVSGCLCHRHRQRGDSAASVHQHWAQSTCPHHIITNRSLEAKCTSCSSNDCFLYFTSLHHSSSDHLFIRSGPFSLQIPSFCFLLRSIPTPSSSFIYVFFHSFSSFLPPNIFSDW